MRVVLVRFFRIISQFVILAIPPLFGLIAAFVMKSLSLFIMVVLLVALMILAFLSQDTNINPARKLQPTNLRSTASPATRVFAMAVLLAALVLAFYIDIGIFMGVVLFIVEFVVVYMLKQEAQRKTHEL